MAKQTSRYALLSVYDKTGIVEFARSIVSLGYKIISTGGTAKVLSENKIPVIPIQEVTGNPESFDGRMKTIGFQIEGGILFDRSNPKHIKEAAELNIKPIDVVVCNLYPFEQTIANPKITLFDAIENIDVGGPTMIRAAAKNFRNVLVIVDPQDYRKISNMLAKTSIAEAFRQQLAAKAFYHLSFYDSQIARFFNKDLFPQELSLALRKKVNLRYGENPHQKASLYMYPNNNSPLNNLKRQWGRELSLVNITDINAGLESLRFFGQPAAVVIKHNSPCGIALGKTAKEALARAIEADPESAFGGIIAINKNMDLATAKIIGDFKDLKRSNIDIVAVPKINKNALEYLKKIRKSMGIYTFGEIYQKRKYQENIKWVNGGLVIQTEDNRLENGFKNWKTVTKIKPAEEQLTLMKIAWKFIARIRSNAVIIVDKNLPMTRGIGSGQTSRIRSTKIALEQAGKYAKGAILASDSFFPFDDSIKLAAKKGISAIVQQGGSVNDKMSIDTADKYKMAMVFTNRRAFWH